MHQLKSVLCKIDDLLTTVVSFTIIITLFHRRPFETSSSFPIALTFNRSETVTYPPPTLSTFHQIGQSKTGFEFEISKNERQGRAPYAHGRHTVWPQRQLIFRG